MGEDDARTSVCRVVRGDVYRKSSIASPVSLGLQEQAAQMLLRHHYTVAMQYLCRGACWCHGLLVPHILTQQRTYILIAHMQNQPFFDGIP